MKQSPHGLIFGTTGIGLKISVIWLAIILLSVCTPSRPAPTPAGQRQALATPTPWPTATPRPDDERFAAALQQRINSLDILPPAGKQATIALYVRKPSHLFPDNAGVVLHFGIGELPDQDEALRAAAMLISAAGWFWRSPDNNKAPPVETGKELAVWMSTHRGLRPVQFDSSCTPGTSSLCSSPA